jgi:hypothetical protein
MARCSDTLAACRDIAGVSIGQHGVGSLTSTRRFDGLSLVSAYKACLYYKSVASAHDSHV